MYLTYGDLDFEPSSRQEDEFVENQLWNMSKNEIYEKLEEIGCDKEEMDDYKKLDKKELVKQVLKYESSVDLLETFDEEEIKEYFEEDAERYFEESKDNENESLWNDKCKWW